MRTPLRFASIASLLFALLAIACQSSAPPGAVHVLTADTDVNGIMERYIDRGIDQAEDQDAAAVVILVDTPGGSIDAMRDIVSRIEDARVPVITYVSPPGAQAASAGTFIVLAGHVAAMAPSTSIGAATPVTATGEDLEGDLGRKVENDTVAFARGVAELRGHNADWAEAAVREAVSASPQQALDQNVVDYVEPSLLALLGTVDGTEVELISGQTQTLEVAEAELFYNNRNVLERVLEIVGDPVVLSILLLVGVIGIMTEIFNPGLFFPGIVGVTSLIATFLGVGTLLPSEAAGLFLLIGVLLIALEIALLPGGVAGTLGAISMVLGLTILVGQGSTQFDFMRFLTYLGLFALTVLVIIGSMLYLLARRHMAGNA